MRRLRPFAALLSAGLLCLAVPAPAFAASGRTVSPADGTVLEGGKVSVEVQATKDSLFDSVESVRVRLSLDGVELAPGTAPAGAACVAGCGSDVQRWVVTFDVSTFQPFGMPDVGGDCNGSLWLQSSINGGNFDRGIQIIRSVPATAPSSVEVTGGVETATVRWERAAEDDILGYAVERRRRGASTWTGLATASPLASKFVDDDVTSGTWEYRVSTLRGDGLHGSSPAPYCGDDEADLASPSSIATATVADEATAVDSSNQDGGTSDGGTTTGGSTGSSHDGTTGGEVDAGEGDSGQTDGASGEPTEDAEDGQTRSTRRLVGTRRAAPPATSTTDNSGALTLQRPMVAPERYYGEDEEFSETLDLEGIDPVTGEPIVTTTTVEVPTALQSILGEQIDTTRLYGSIAGGLIAITLAFHLRRWARAGQVD